MSIQVRNLTHIYAEGLPHESIALENVNFDIYDGEFVGIIGHTGSGKSTLLQHLNGLLKPNKGTIVIDDKEITAHGVTMNEVRKRIGLVFQYPEYQLFEETVALDVAFGPRNLGLDQEMIDARVREAIELVGLDYEDVAERSPFELSGGQKRRVAIAGVIAMKPKVLILDEPTAGLDPKAHKDVLAMIQEVHRRENNIIIMVSHNMADIAKNCDKVLVMDSGKLIMSGTPREVFSQGERLNQIGLNPPPVTMFMKKLAGSGVDIDSDVLFVEEAEDKIIEYLQRK